MPPRWIRILSLLAAIAGLGALALLARLVYEHERAELDFGSEPRTLAELARAPGSTAVSARIARVELDAGEHALFELCARDRLEPARWLGAFDLVVFQLPEMKLMLRVPLDAEHLRSARRNASGACLMLGSGTIERTGAYSLDAVWPRAKPAAPLLQIPLQARVLGTRAVGPQGKLAWLLLAVSTLSLLAVQLTRRRHAGSDPQPQPGSNPQPQPGSNPQPQPGSNSQPQPGSHHESDPRSVASPAPRLRDRRLPLTAAAIALLGAVIFVTQIPTAGALATMAKGLALIALQCAVPLALARMWRSDRALLPLTPRIEPALAYALAAGAAVLLWGSARLALRLVPATGEAPIQTFVSWPSGMLCFAALGVLLPVGEELLFRGLLYRALLGWTARPGLAALLCWLPFVALHAQQSWGNWGGLVSIATAGAVLTALRVASGSVLVPALAHVLYNFALSAGAFW